VFHGLVLADVFNVSPQRNKVTAPIPRGKIRPFSSFEIDFEAARFSVRARGVLLNCGLSNFVKRQFGNFLALILRHRQVPMFSIVPGTLLPCSVQNQIVLFFALHNEPACLYRPLIDFV
jgi:hypothetical protein